MNGDTHYEMTGECSRTADKERERDQDAVCGLIDSGWSVPRTEVVHGSTGTVSK